MPRDYQLLQPWTQQLLRLARSGKVGSKRKPDPDSMDEDKPEDEVTEEAKANLEDRGYVAKKWKPVPEALLEPEHKHFEFLAKRRKGLPGLYGPEQQNGGAVAMRKTKVQKASADGELAVYEVLIPEGQTVDGEVTETTELPVDAPVAAPPAGTVIEGVGIANAEGVVVAEHLKPAVAPRRNRPPPKKKGGPGRGKKRVTFTNPDGSTYTTVVPNATKIVPQPGQTVKHVAKGEEATADVTVADAKKSVPASEQADGEGEGEGEAEGEGEDGEDDEDGEEGDEDDDREDGELSDEDAPEEGTAPPQSENADKGTNADAEPTTSTDEAAPTEASKARDASSSPELPLAKTGHSRHGSLAETPQVALSAVTSTAETQATEGKAETASDATAPALEEEPEVEKFEDGEEDLLGNLEKHLEGE